MSTITEYEFKKSKLIEEKSRISKKQVKNVQQRDSLKKSLTRIKCVAGIFAFVSVISICAILRDINTDALPADDYIAIFAFIFIILFSNIILFSKLISKQIKFKKLNGEISSAQKEIDEQIDELTRKIKEIDIDLLTIEMTPENIRRLEDEALTFFTHISRYYPNKYDPPRNFWLYRYMYFYEADEYYVGSNSAEQSLFCRKKLEDSGSWILIVVARFWGIIPALSVIIHDSSKMPYHYSINQCFDAKLFSDLMTNFEGKKLTPPSTPKEKAFLSAFIKATERLGYSSFLLERLLKEDL